MLWDRGTWESDDPERGFKKGDLKFTLHGDKLHGSWVLVRMKGDRYGGKRTNWLLIKHRDEYAKEGEAHILEEDRSVASGRAMAQIAQGKGKAPKPFMLAKNNRRPMRSGSRTAAKRPTRAPAENSSTAGHAGNQDAGAGAKRQAEEGLGDAGFRRAAALRLGRAAAERGRLVP